MPTVSSRRTPRIACAARQKSVVQRLAFGGSTVGVGSQNA